MSFGKNFIWGAASSAYQIEGAAFEDNKGWSVWDMMCKKDGAIARGEMGDVACDHYHRYKEDIEIMKEIGIKSYRMSLSWPRIIPEGTGKVNQAGLDFYDRLVDGLLEKDIEPYFTLFHWDYPYELYKKGGILNRDSSDWFAEYVSVLVDKFSDRVRRWATMNEPEVYLCGGHKGKIHAPGLSLSMPERVIGVHNLLLAHGKGVQVIRQHAKKPVEISYACIGSGRYPAVEIPEVIEATRRFSFDYDGNEILPALWLDPIFTGKYHEYVMKNNEQYLPKTLEEDLKIISSPIDALGLNYYCSTPMNLDESGKLVEVKFSVGHPKSTLDFPITPRGIYWAVKYFSEQYNIPVYITENGLTGLEWVSLDGKVHDPQRIDYMERHFIELQKAIQDKVDIRGYYAWTLLDNFEWNNGYKERFGLVHVDFTTQKRTMKDSAYWYKEVIESNGGKLKGR